MVEFSLIVPCYNEEKNILHLSKKIILLSKYIKFETILIDNGSIDNTSSEIIKLKKKINNLKLIFIKKNQGFGYAIKKGITASKRKILCYTHADLQTDIKDVLKAYRIFKKNKNKKVFIKGSRLKRTFSEIVFSFGMSFFCSLLFFKKMNDIHAQPNFFKRELITKVKYLPNDFSLDIYMYLLAKIKKHEIIRFDVFFNKRIYGKGNNENLLKKFSHSFKIVRSSIKMFLYGKF